VIRVQIGQIKVAESRVNRKPHTGSSRLKKFLRRGFGLPKKACGNFMFLHPVFAVPSSDGSIYTASHEAANDDPPSPSGFGGTRRRDKSATTKNPPARSVERYR
jgi:hypothetical protein